jgi:hypothetical protein
MWIANLIPVSGTDVSQSPPGDSDDGQTETHRFHGHKAEAFRGKKRWTAENPGIFKSLPL